MAFDWKELALYLAAAAVGWLAKWLDIWRAPRVPKE